MDLLAEKHKLTNIFLDRYGIFINLLHTRDCVQRNLTKTYQSGVSDNLVKN